jgi:UDP-N-acetylmuramate dehydrogenase
MVCVLPDVSLTSFTAYHVGGLAQWFAQPTTLPELYEVLTWANDHQHPLTVIGAGTNLLVSDAGVAGLVLSLRQLQGGAWGTAGQVRALAGEPLARLAWQSARRGWHGLEWAVGIPGSAGGAVVMNAGAHGWEMQQLVLGAEVLNLETGEVTYRSPTSLEFGYRHSALQKEPCVVLAVDLQLAVDHDSVLLVQKVEDYNRHRRQTQPQGVPNCGSVFRNPTGKAAGWLLEQSGLKGFRLGGAEVAQAHANFILNRDHARAQDILNLMDHMQTRVYKDWGIALQAEVKLLGKFEESSCQ